MATETKAAAQTAKQAEAIKQAKAQQMPVVEIDAKGMAHIAKLQNARARIDRLRQLALSYVEVRELIAENQKLKAALAAKEKKDK